MSYILDALRRAEAERGRGGVPGLHSQTVPVHGAAPAAARPLAAHPAVLLGGALALAAVAAGGTWWAMQRPGGTPAVQVAAVPPLPTAPASPPAVAPAQPSPAVAVPAPAPAAAVAPPPEPAAPVAATASPPPAAPAVPLPERRAPEKRVAEKPRERPAAEVTAQRAGPAPLPASLPVAVGESPRARPSAAPAPGTAAVASPVQPVAAQGPGAATAPPPAAPVFAQADLPEAIRSQLPALKISGATYSNNPAHRMAIVNGQVLLEGDQAGPGLVLERVEQSRTVWSFRGYRYAVGSQ